MGQPRTCQHVLTQNLGSINGHGPHLVPEASAKAVDFRAFLRALRGFEDAEADLLDQADWIREIGVGWVAARDRIEMGHG